MTDIAGRWGRVSGDTQSERDQFPDIDAYCADRGYVKGRVFEVHGKSAYKGAQDPDWLKVVRAIQDGEITLVVCWMVDRLDRQNILHAIPMVLAVLDAGGRIEFSEQPECNLDAKSPTIDDEVKAFSDRIHAANQESKIKSKRVLKAFRRRRETGSALNRSPWGYEIVCTACEKPPVNPGCRGHAKMFVPTSAARKYIPPIFARAAAGESCGVVAAWLTAENVPTTRGGAWNEGYLANRLIKNPIYYGQRRNGGNLETEGVVTYPEWLAANAALSSRAKSGRSAVVRDKALLSPVCGNPECDATGKHPSPMYRTDGGYGKNRVPYYRCTGRGPQRKGCGNMIPMAELDEIVMEAMAGDEAGYVRREFIPGNDRSAEVGKLRRQAVDAYASGNKTRFLELDALADELAAVPGVAAHWEDRETGMTRGAYFTSLTAPAARREYISGVTVWAHKNAEGLAVVSIEIRPWGG